MKQSAGIVTERYIDLLLSEQKEVLEAGAARSGLSPAILEKDIWACWALDCLFSMPERHAMVFKGGTSLSKVYNAISRFSEDIDVTIDHRALNPDLDPFAADASKTAIKRLRDLAKAYVADVIAPHFRRSATVIAGGDRVTTSIGESGEDLFVSYTGLTATSEHVPAIVRLEFGGRNVIDPHKEIGVHAYIAEHVPAVDFPTARVDTLAAERTFWEKVTLIHAACCTDRPSGAGDRFSRHWYDTYRLLNSDVGARALADRELLRSVAQAKSIFFPQPGVNYRDCIEGRLRVVPSEELRRRLAEDYRRMIEARMLFPPYPSFAEIETSVSSLQQQVNSRER